MPFASAYVIALASVVIVSDDELNVYPTFLERIYGPNHHRSPPPGSLCCLTILALQPLQLSACSSCSHIASEPIYAFLPVVTARFMSSAAAY